MRKKYREEKPNYTKLWFEFLGESAESFSEEARHDKKFLPVFILSIIGVVIVIFAFRFCTMSLREPRFTPAPDAASTPASALSPLEN